MQIEIKLDETCREPKIIIVTPQITDEINRLMSQITSHTPSVLTGFSEENAVLLDTADIYRIYASDGKVYAVTQQGTFTLRLRLYEAEERLDKAKFVRISNAEIIHLKKIESFDLSMAGTICVKLTDHTVSYVSRRYVAKIKKLLGL